MIHTFPTAIHYTPPFLQQMSTRLTFDNVEEQLSKDNLRRITTRQQERDHDDDDDVDSNVSEYDSDSEYSKALLAAQREWEESLDQLYRALQLVILPLIGKFLGRRAARLIWRSVATYLWS